MDKRQLFEEWFSNKFANGKALLAKGMSTEKVTEYKSYLTEISYKAFIAGMDNQ